MSVDTPHPDLRSVSRPAPISDVWSERAPVPMNSALPVRQSSGPVRPGRLRVVGAALAATVALGAGLTMRGGGAAHTVPSGGAGAAWQIDVASGGAHGVTALVYGSEAGLHVVRVPAAGAPAAERRQVAARLGAGDVYLVSLGWDPLVVETVSPPGTAAMSFGARSRFVKLYRDARGTGIRTGWR